MRTVLVASAAAAAVALAVVAGWSWLQSRAPITIGSTPAVVAKSAPNRPAWIPTVTRPLGTCTETETGFACVGVSTLAETVAKARAEAVESALEALVERLATGIADPDWQRLVVAQYAPARRHALADSDGRAARNGRRAVAIALHKTAAQAPSFPDAEYWERYAGANIDATVSFARFDISAAELAALAHRYTVTNEVLGGRAVTAFPSLAWRDANMNGGAQLTTVGTGPLATAGLAVGDIVIDLGGTPIAEAGSFATAVTFEAERLADAGGTIGLTVKRGDGPLRAVHVAIARSTVSTHPLRTNRSDQPSRISDMGGVNIWDRTGGGTARDNPND